MKRIRLSLRSLLLLVFTIGGAMGVWWRWEPWVFERTYSAYDSKMQSTFSNDGSQFLTVGADNPACVWDVLTGSQKARLIEADSYNGYSSFSFDSKRVVTVRTGSSVCVWDATNGGIITEFDVPRSVWHAVFSVDGRFILTATQGGIIQTWDSNTGAPISLLRGHTGLVHELDFSFDRKSVVMSVNKVGEQRPAVILFNLEDKSERVVFDGFADVVAFSRDGQNILTTNLRYDWKVRIWNAATGKQRAEYFMQECSSAAISSDSMKVALASPNGKIQIWSVDPQIQLSEIDADNAPIGSLKFSPDGTRLLFEPTTSNGVRLWKCQRPEQWWGIAWLPEFWITSLCVVGLIWSFAWDWRNLKRQSSKT